MTIVNAKFELRVCDVESDSSHGLMVDELQIRPYLEMVVELRVDEEVADDGRRPGAAGAAGSRWRPPSAGRGA